MACYLQDMARSQPHRGAPCSHGQQTGPGKHANSSTGGPWVTPIVPVRGQLLIHNGDNARVKHHQVYVAALAKDILSNLGHSFTTRPRN
eukprot:scaffold207_cov409-Prasinococcus_capsulatus_cf.AAC.112